MRYFIIIILFIFSLNLNAQTSNENANKQLEELKIAILNSNYQKVVEFAYPKIYQPLSKKQMTNLMTSMYDKMKVEGFIISDVTFSSPSDIIENGKELQFTVDENLFVQTPKGLVLGIYTLIGISNDNGLNWKFVDTSGKSKDDVIKKLPNLSSKLTIKPAEKYLIDITTPSN